MMITGKGISLEYITNNLPHIPIPEFIRVPPDLKRKKIFRKKEFPDDGRVLRKLAKKIGYPLIVRSDSKYEAGLGRTFPGMFNSIAIADVFDRYTLEKKVEQVRNDWKIGPINRYAEIRGIKLDELPIDIILQKYIKSEARAIITKHPHMDGAYFLDFNVEHEYIGPNYYEKIGSIHHLDSSPKRALMVHKDGPGRRNSTITHLLANGIVRELEEVFNHIQEIEALEGFPDNIAYQAEITLLPYSFVQWREFRLIEKADFKVDDVAPKNDAIYHSDLVLGITPKEGVELVHYPEGVPVDRKDNIAFSYFKGMKYHFTHDNIVYLQPSLLLPMDFISVDSKGKPETCQPWQTHAAMEFMELGQLVAWTSDAPFTNEVGKNLRYWSDGIHGRIQFL